MVAALIAVMLVGALSFGLVGCDNGATGGNGGDGHTHSYSATWSKNTTQHWYECSCGDKKDVANHTGDPCICGYTGGIAGGGEGSLEITGFDTQYISLTITIGTTDVATIKARDLDDNPTIIPILETKSHRSWYADDPVSATLVGTTLTMSLPAFNGGVKNGTYNIFMTYTKEIVSSRGSAVIGSVTFDSNGNGTFAWGDRTEIKPHIP